jgi:hypothetical protein
MSKVLTEIERAALRRAKSDGWLTLTKDMRDVALKRWQRECDHSGHPFAVLRMEPQRASLWFILASGREWNAREKALARDSLANARGVLLTPNSAQAFVELGSEAPVMKRLLMAVDAVLYRGFGRRLSGDSALAVPRFRST